MQHAQILHLNSQGSSAHLGAACPEGIADGVGEQETAKGLQIPAIGVHPGEVVVRVAAMDEHRLGRPGLEPFAGRYPARTVSQILVLERVPKVLCRQPSVRALTPAQTLTELVGRFFMQEGSALDVLDAACRLAETVPCATFRYADLDEAAELLGRLLQGPAHGDGSAAGQGLFFDGWEDALLPAPGRQGDDGADAEEAEEARADALALLDEGQDVEDENAPDPDYESSRIGGTQEYCRCEGVLLEQRLGTDFLVNPSRDGIHVLNETGRIIWQLLADPLSLDEACLLLEEVYPGTDPACIAGDLQELCADLLDAGLIRPCI